MAKNQRIRMTTGMAGDAISYAPDQVLVVGKDIERDLAIAYCVQGDAPRAVPLDGWNPWEEAGMDRPGSASHQTYAGDEDEEPETGEPGSSEDVLGDPGTSQDGTEQPGEGSDAGGEKRDGEDGVDGEKRDGEDGEPGEERGAPAEGETATAPAQETRETATQKRSRGKRVTPPAEKTEPEPEKTE